jgi:phosphomannomutase
MLPLDPIFKAYDIRGTTPDQLDPPTARAIGAAFAAFAKADRVVIARDMRPSGVEISSAFADGVMSQGVDVIDIGLASTDLLYFAAGTLDAPGAMVTASHNPAQYNGIKMCLAGAKPIGQDTGLADIKAMAEGGGPAGTGKTAALTTQEMLPAFAEHVRRFFGDGRRRPLKVVADCANGMGGLVAPAVFEDLGFDLTLLYPELDGTFPNHPADPINPDNIRDLQAKVLELGADVGLAFDGDADRVFLVDDRANGVSGSTTTAMVGATMLDRAGQTGTVLHNLICSKSVPEVIREHGGTPVRTRVGHSFIKATMAETGAIFGGEHSGHYYFADNFNADSGIIASMVVLGVLCAADVPLSELRKPFERYAASGEINTEVPDPQAVIARVEATFTGRDGVALDHLDGLTVTVTDSEVGDWWFNLRASNTEPLLRLNLEAPDAAACDARTGEVLALIKES